MFETHATFIYKYIESRKNIAPTELRRRAIEKLETTKKNIAFATNRLPKIKQPEKQARVQKAIDEYTLSVEKMEALIAYLDKNAPAETSA